MANYIRDTASQNLVAKIANNPMPLRCKYSKVAQINADESKSLVNPLDGRVDSPAADELVPDDLPIAEEINPYEFHIISAQLPAKAAGQQDSGT
ncbi:MAG: hypothetical protein L0H10_27335 [Comamonas sp.]|uniref:hypothetical protein n=1 Tax=Comamonas sp. TaxID=34028 RepID=UPI002648452E|nr:hypothetical protein [Comamonas sp.]MDN5507494.1 hypothetical protein [Comamonas sp.]MDN5540688.1 hypothetical protein [Comamonas sp.]